MRFIRKKNGSSGLSVLLGIEIAIEIAIGIGFSLLIYCISSRSRVFLSKYHGFCGLDPDFDPDFDSDENIGSFLRLNRNSLLLRRPRTL